VTAAHVSRSTPGAQAALGAVIADAAISRAPGLSRLARLNQLCTRYELRAGFWHQPIRPARYRRLRAAYRAELFAPITLVEQYGPTTTDGESHLTDEDVLAEVAESQERAHVQLFGRDAEIGGTDAPTLSEYACDCNGEGKCGYCAEQAVCRAEFYGQEERP
jgi:hypothetical protein